MTLYHLKTWSHGAPFFAAGEDIVSFVRRRGDATLYSEDQALAIQKRFRKSKAKLRLKLEPAEPPRPSREPPKQIPLFGYSPLDDELRDAPDALCLLVPTGDARTAPWVPSHGQQPKRRRRCLQRQHLLENADCPDRPRIGERTLPPRDRQGLQRDQ
jgi:hypothetical protein